MNTDENMFDKSSRHQKFGNLYKINDISGRYESSFSDDRSFEFSCDFNELVTDPQRSAMLNDF